jgi:uncharacterized protein (DUF433 family)
MIPKPEIINRGRGPEIAGTRITVYDVLDFRKIGWRRDRIAGHFLLSSDQIQAAFDYIDSHQEEVEAAYDRMLEWVKNYEYPPEVQAKIDAIRARAEKRLEVIRARRSGSGHYASDPL